MCLRLYLRFLFILYIEIIFKEFLILINITKAQTLYIEKMIKVVMIDEH